MSKNKNPNIIFNMKVINDIMRHYKMASENPAYDDTVFGHRKKREKIISNGYINKSHRKELVKATGIPETYFSGEEVFKISKLLNVIEGIPKDKDNDAIDDYFENRSGEISDVVDEVIRNIKKGKQSEDRYLDSFIAIVHGIKHDKPLKPDQGYIEASISATTIALNTISEHEIYQTAIDNPEQIKEFIKVLKEKLEIAEVVYPATSYIRANPDIINNLQKFQ